ncbi:MAG: cytochrome c family protein [Bacteroidetes bacterium]|nr:cytochrome c family protein [Bacteroidota bacterium]
MRKLTLIAMAIALTSVVSLAGEASHQYVGVNVCAMCHKTPKNGEQFQKWQASKHSQAMKVLSSPEALKIAKEKGLKGAPSESPECLQCHETAYNAPASQLGPRFNKEDGVQCETCHGPGKDYMKMDVMKNQKLAVANGLVLLSIKDGSAEKLCMTCHNKKSPTFKGFDFKTMWSQIAHPVPAN